MIATIIYHTMAFVGICVCVLVACVFIYAKWEDFREWRTEYRNIDKISRLRSELHSIGRWCASYPQVVETCKRIVDCLDDNGLSDMSQWRRDKIEPHGKKDQQ